MDCPEVYCTPALALECRYLTAWATVCSAINSHTHKTHVTWWKLTVVEIKTKLLFQRCMNLLDVGARESLSDVISKVLRKVANQPEGKDEDLDDTLLTWSVELMRHTQQHDMCQMLVLCWDDYSVPQTCCDIDCSLTENRDQCHCLFIELVSQSHNTCKALNSVVKLLLLCMCKHNVSWAGALLSNSSFCCFVWCRFCGMMVYLISIPCLCLILPPCILQASCSS